MKRNAIAKPGLIVLSAIGLGLAVFIMSCEQRQQEPGGQKSGKTSSFQNIIRAEYGTRIFTEEVQGVVSYDSRGERSIAGRVSGRIKRLLIRYNYQPVRKGQLIMEIYAPDLAAAQQEALFLLRSEKDPSLLAGARQRLLLLGMDAASVDRLLRSGKVSYRVPVYSPADGYVLEPSAAANSPVLLREGQYISAGQSLFTIYNDRQLIAEFSLRPALAALIRKGDKFTFYKTADKNTIQVARVGLVQPVLKAGENFTVARTYLDGQGFRVGELLTAKIPVLLSQSWWLPQSAVVSLGSQSVVYRKEGNAMVPETVITGLSIAGMVQIKTDIGGWDISKQAAYLTDSESFIRKNTGKK